MKFNICDTLLAVIPVVITLVVGVWIVSTQDITGDFNWSIAIAWSLAWFYVSVLLAGLTILYAQHQFYVSLGYIASIILFVLLVLGAATYLWAMAVGVSLLAYAATIFVFKFFVSIELKYQQIERVSVFDLGTLLIPFFTSVVTIFVGIFASEFIVITSEQMTTNWFLIGIWVYLVGLGVGLGYFGRLPFTTSMIAGLSILSMTLLFDALQLQQPLQWFSTFACFFIPFIITNLVKFGVMGVKHEPK